MSRPETQPRIGIGIPSVLMVLVVLAMAALCMLSYTNASSTETMTLRNAEVSVDYYKMAADVQEKLSLLDAELLSRKDLPLSEKTVGLEMEGVAFSEKEGQLFFTLTVSGESDLSLCLEGVVLDGAEDRYRIIAHRTQSVAAVEDPPYLELMGGEH
ncbi:MAG: hypothetical protein E7331_00830 [Clostridiales bacterium]|nr:hypothetical protein [Clostridiales bacterium]